MIIKILGMGCLKCERLEKLARETAKELKIDAEFVKVKNMNEIMNYEIVGTPALVINEIVKSSGRIPAKEEIIEWCRDRMAGYKRPKTIEFRDELPLSQVGKILRRVLRNEEINR